MNFIKKHWWKILIVFFVVIAVMALLGFKRGEKTDLNNPPKFIQTDFIDLDKIFAISKFRSGGGHSFTNKTEKCRSQKHYFNPQITAEGEKERQEGNGKPKPPSAGREIDIFSPVDGKISGVKEEQFPIGKQIYIKPDSASQFTLRLFHIYLLPGIKEGSTVKAGQKVGEIGLHQNTDIAVAAGPKWNERFISYFSVMPESVFEKYKARGAATREDFIISKEERDANPLQCNGEQFVKNYDDGSNTDHFVRLSGWKPGF